MEFSPKLMPLYGVVLLVGWLCYAGYHGRRYSVTKDKLMLGHHQDGVEWAMWSLALTIALILMARRIVGPVSRPDMLYVHLPLALFAVGLFVSILARYDGLRAPALHYKLAYASVACFALSLITGLYMLWHM